MKCTVGRVSAIMILLAFVLSFAFAVSIVSAQVSENQTNQSYVQVSDHMSISDSIETGAGETSNETTQEEGFISNETMEQNDTVQSAVNATEIEELVNETTLDENLTAGKTQKPIFNVDLEYPSIITRGEDMSIVANLTSDLYAKSVQLTWYLPDGMVIASGNGTENCGNLSADSYCTSNIVVRTETSVIGLSEIRVVVTYEE